MTKHYTRACNFYYGMNAKSLIAKKLALPLCGEKKIAFDKVEIFKRKGNKVSSKVVNIRDIKFLKDSSKKKVKKDLQKITSKRKNFLNNVNFLKPSIMGILNLTPDSFSDGGKFNSKNKAYKHIAKMIKGGANIIDIGGESTRPGSKTVPDNLEWNRIGQIVKNFKKKYKSSCLSVDTRKSDLMIKSISYGADLINDVSGFNYDHQTIDKINDFDVAKVIHHMQGTLILCKKIQNIKMFYLIFTIFLRKRSKK